MRTVFKLYVKTNDENKDRKKEERRLERKVVTRRNKKMWIKIRTGRSKRGRKR